MEIKRKNIKEVFYMKMLEKTSYFTKKGILLILLSVALFISHTSIVNANPNS